MNFKSTLGSTKKELGYNEHLLQQKDFLEIKLIESQLGWRFVQI